MYPELRKHPHLVGHYGGAWQKQKKEFAQFNGAVLGTTNCVLIPRDEYKDRLFTTRVTAVPGGRRLANGDFSEVIECAKRCRPLVDQKVGESTIGFHHSVLLGLAGPLGEAVKAGTLKRFFLIGGCDGAEPGRNYFSDYARLTPRDSLIRTLGCGKYRIREHDSGSIEIAGVGPVPRLLDMGQCSNAYGAIQVAVALSKARLRRQRPAADHRALLVRAEGGRRVADAVGSGCEEFASVRRRQRSSRRTSSRSSRTSTTSR
jgi:hydroxylamine reductase